MTTTSVPGTSDGPAGEPERVAMLPEQHDPMARPSLAERRERGKQARAMVPRKAHAGFTADLGRRDPVDILIEQAGSRVPDLVPIRYGRMVSSPFAFLRGAAAIMAADLSHRQRTGLRVQLCGDAHLMNFGVFSTPERAQVFDINDFDETLPGPWEWDVARLVASVEVAGRSRGFDLVQREAAVRVAVQSYRSAMGEFAQMRTLDIWYASMPVERMLLVARERHGEKAAKRVQRVTDKALTRDSLQAVAKYTVRTAEGPRFVHLPPLLVPIRELVTGAEAERLRTELVSVLRSYRRTLSEDRRQLLGRYRLVDVAHKVVGVGSVGTRAWVALLAGRDDDDPLVLQLKEAQPSVLEPYLGHSGFGNAGQRVVVGQRLMQAVSDIFLGWQHVDRGLDERGRDFYVRQLRDGKGSVEVADLRAPGLASYAGLCGWTLARAHARSGDPVAIAAYLGRSTTFDDAMVTFARAYADQTERDHAELEAAVKSGRVPAETGI